jgi:peptide-methionine (S)-S-oxide reductase
MRHRVILAVAVLLALGYAWLRGGFVGVLEGRAPGPLPATSPAEATEKATFAAGCFWCVEADFDKLPGVLSTTSGYTGGTLKDPSYEQVSRGGTGHTEAVEIVYDPAKVSYAQLLDHFWKNVDPLTAHRQFCDVGDQYRPAIFFHNETQRKVAEESKTRVQQQYAEPVVVQIAAAGPFYRAEGYHQDYYQKNPVRYRYYRWGCNRDSRLAELSRKQSK